MNEQQEAQLAQARMMRRFKESAEFALLNNTFLVEQRKAKEEFMRKMRLQSTRENCLYYSGLDHGVEICLQAVDKIIADGDAIEATKKLVAQYGEAE